MQELNLAGYSISAILMVVLTLVYKYAPTFTNRWKPLIAIVAGIALQILVMLYNEIAFTVQNVIHSFLQGGAIGLGAIGFYEGVSKTFNWEWIKPEKKED